MLEDSEDIKVNLVQNLQSPCQNHNSYSLVAGPIQVGQVSLSITRKAQVHGNLSSPISNGVIDCCCPCMSSCFEHKPILIKDRPRVIFNSVKFVNSTPEALESALAAKHGNNRKKRCKTTEEQLKILQKAFQTDPIPNAQARIILSKKLGMSARAVQVWFQNRRAKEKQNMKRQEKRRKMTDSVSSNTGIKEDDYIDIKKETQDQLIQKIKSDTDMMTSIQNQQLKFTTCTGTDCSSQTNDNNITNHESLLKSKRELNFISSLNADDHLVNQNGLNTLQDYFNPTNIVENYHAPQSVSTDTYVSIDNLNTLSSPMYYYCYPQLTENISSVNVSESQANYYYLSEIPVNGDVQCYYIPTSIGSMEEWKYNSYFHSIKNNSHLNPIDMMASIDDNINCTEGQESQSYKCFYHNP